MPRSPALVISIYWLRGGEVSGYGIAGPIFDFFLRFKLLLGMEYSPSFLETRLKRTLFLRSTHASNLLGAPVVHISRTKLPLPPRYTLQLVSEEQLGTVSKKWATVMNSFTKPGTEQ